MVFFILLISKASSKKQVFTQGSKKIILCEKLLEFWNRKRSAVDFRQRNFSVKLEWLHKLLKKFYLYFLQRS